MYFLQRRLFLNTSVLFMFTMFCVAAATAQERNSTITGRVSDSTHALLQGARIEVQPTGQTAVSSSKGEFTISGLVAGHYTVTVSYVGFTPFTSELNIIPGGVANVDVVLQVEAKSEEITVNGGREHGEIEALNRERTADNILQVLPSEVITSLPNTNIADAVGRLPSVSLERDEGEGKYVQIRGTEPRLSNVTVDGLHLPSPEGVRNVKLDAIPSDLVDSVEISKTLSANQEGDAIGGSVNLVTKTAHDDPYVSVLAMGGYTPIQTGRWLDQFTATAGQRFGKEKRFGILLGGSFDWNERGIYDIEPGQLFNPLTNGQFFSGPNAIDYRDYWYNRSRYGFGGTADYKLGEFSSVYFRGLFSRFNDSGQDWIYSPAVGSFDTANGPVGISNVDGSSSFTQVWRTPQQRIFSVAAGARHDIGTTIITYDLSLGQGRQVGGFPRASFVPNPNDPNAPLNNNVKFSVDTTHPFTPKFNVLNGMNIFDPTSYFLDGYQTANNHNYERDVTGSFSVIHQYNIGSHYGSFEIGSKVRDSRKSQLDNQQFFDGDDSLPLSSVLGAFRNSDYYFGKYQFGPTSDWNKVVALANANLGGAVTENSNKELVRSIPNDYVINERVSAGYAMNTINFGPVRLQAGVRIEATDDSLLGNHVLLDNGKYQTTAPVIGNHDYIDVLPSVQVQYSFGDNKIRAAYGMGIARPNFGDLPPFITQDDARNKISVGNPALRPTRANDYDLLFERYLKPAGVIQFGAFYKDLRNPIYENVQSPVIAGTFAGFTQSQAINGPRAHISGLEMTWQQHLAFLPGPLNGLGVRANYSYTTSQASFPNVVSPDPNLPSRSDHPALLRQAPNNWNFDLTYDKKGFSGRIGLTHNDANIFAYNYQPALDGSNGPLHGPNGDVYLYPHTQLDAQASYWIPNGHGLQAVVSALNLTNEVFGFYQGSERFPIQREFYDRTVSFGLRWTLTREPK
ncbi:MAG TPA: TonB-dependent receptor [Terriglobales bacterium]|nr:TonB-dependent receptor [Terriglobales bacterium]